ncbi:ABC transporter substrate-binding protein [Actinomadura rugatobispora]|uniref:ABC transporter substrate-binding protein n=1 Tax=Actinomadura rugatobispora TaxID=1994 RepID=A0ABW1A2J2_9ACTN|nr:ABC transporter substrate-binding protein [Actinomadura rugatobispora]
MHSTHPIRPLAAAAPLLLLLAACGSPGAATGDATLSLGEISHLQTFDPAKANTPQIAYLRPVFDTLISSRGSGEYGPGLATTWTYTGSDLVLTLRKGVKFTDGTPFDSSVVKANIERGKKVDGPLAAVSYNLVEKVETPDPYTAELRLARPGPSIVQMLSGVPGMMLSPKAFNDPKVDRNPVGTGPWKLDAASSVEGDSYTYAKNTGYWDPSVQKADKVRIRAYTDAGAMINALRGGQVQAGPVSGAQVRSAEQSGLTVERDPGLPAGLLVLDRDGGTVPALKDVRVRQAMAYAMDRAAINSSVMFGTGDADGNLFDDRSPAYEPALKSSYPADLAKARRLMAEAGHPDGFAFDLPTNPVFANLAEAVAGALGKIGIRARLVNLQAGNLAVQLRSRKYPVAVLQLPADDPYLFYQQTLSPKGPYNPYGATDPRIEALAARASTKTIRDGAAEYRGLYRRAAEQGYVITLVRGYRMLAVRKGVSGAIPVGTAPDPRNVTAR